MRPRGKEFELEGVLAVMVDSSQSLVSAERAEEVTEFIIGERINPGNCDRACKHVRDELGRQHPWLRTLSVPKFKSDKQRAEWLNRLKSVHGLSTGMIKIYPSQSWRPETIPMRRGIIW